jgi:hypothetical protein
VHEPQLSAVRRTATATSSAHKCTPLSGNWLRAGDGGARSGTAATTGADSTAAPTLLLTLLTLLALHGLALLSLRALLSLLSLLALALRALLTLLTLLTLRTLRTL